AAVRSPVLDGGRPGNGVGKSPAPPAPAVPQASSDPSSTGARNQSRPPATVRSRGADDCQALAKARTISVPASVPSLFHSAEPPSAVEATKNAVPPRSVKAYGDELSGPGFRSRTSRVPASVPSLAHSSTP